MFKDNAIWMGVGSEPDNKPVSLLLDQANRHGLIAGASGTGKTVTLKAPSRTRAATSSSASRTSTSPSGLRARRTARAT